MNRSYFYKLISVVLACFVLASTSMSSMRLHFCGGQIAGISLFAVDDSCCSPGASLACEINTEADGCCQDKVIDLDWDVDITTQSISSDNAIDDHFIAPTISITNDAVLAITTARTIVTIPPLLNEKRTILFGSFLL